MDWFTANATYPLTLEIVPLVETVPNQQDVSVAVHVKKENSLKN